MVYLATQKVQIYKTLVKKENSGYVIIDRVTSFNSWETVSNELMTSQLVNELIYEASLGKYRKPRSDRALEDILRAYAIVFHNQKDQLFKHWYRTYVSNLIKRAGVNLYGVTGVRQKGIEVHSNPIQETLENVYSTIWEIQIDISDDDSEVLEHILKKEGMKYIEI